VYSYTERPDQIKALVPQSGEGQALVEETFAFETKWGFPISLRKCEGDLFQIFSLFSHHEMVKGDDEQLIGAFLQYAGEVGRAQLQFIGASIQGARNIGGDQIQGVGAALQFVGEVGRDQVQGVGAALQYAGNVKGRQYQIAGFAIRYAENIEGSQFTGTGTCVNVAKNIGGNQSGLVNIVTKSSKGRQLGLLNYSNDPKTRQFGLINLRRGKHWWNPEISFFYRGAKEE